MSPPDFWFRHGHDNVGPLCVGFVGWLARRFAEDGVERIAFIARDGHLIERIYRRMVPEGEGPPATYLYGSRRAFNVPAITALDERALAFLCGGSSRLAVADYLRRAGLLVDRCRAQVTAVGFSSPEQPVVSPEERARLRGLFQALEPELLAIAEGERGRLVGYLAQEGLLSGRVALVDLGWHGTLQRSLREVLRVAGAKTELHGYYLATFPEAAPLATAGQRMAGYLCENGQPDRHYWTLRACVELFEFAFVAPHGGVVGYVAEGGGFRPLLSQHDVLPEDLRKADQLQRGVLAYVDDHLERHARRPDLPPGVAIAGMERLLYRPTFREARRLGDLRHSEGFGEVFERRAIARLPPLATLLRDPRALETAFERAFWQEGYRTRLLGSNRALRRMADRGWQLFSRLRASYKRAP